MDHGTHDEMGFADMGQKLEAEQEQALLHEWKTKHKTKQSLKRAKQSCKIGVAVIVLAACSVVAVLLLVVSGAMSRESQYERAHNAGVVTISGNDYVLDPEWDFHASPRRREYWWTVRDHEHNPDGIFRPMILVNNQYPGPLIEVNEFDTIVVHVDNQAVNATSIHWHGLFQNSTSWMDGTTGISQCPIAPGTTFTYQFQVARQSGTYWWHAHVGLQSSDGLHGPLIIHSREEKSLQKIGYQSDRVILLSDHYHDLSSALLWQYLKPDMENAEPVPVGGLINGRSVRSCEQFEGLGRACDNTTANVGLPHIQLEANKAHRLRLINVGALAEFQFQIDEHELAVTEVDGTDTLPAEYHRVNISPAQRYSVVVNATMTTGSSFWLRARMVTSCFTDPPRTLDPDVLAVVQYASAHEFQVPTTRDWEDKLAQECKDMDTKDLVPAQAIPAPQDADAFFYLRSNFEIGRWRLSRGLFNSSSFRPNVHSPTLHRAIDGLASANKSFLPDDSHVRAFVNEAAFDTPRELVIQSTGVQTIDFLISNFDDGNHPLHLHGYKYFVLAQGHGYPPLTEVGAAIEKANLAPLYDSLDLSNPLRRDTASAEAFGWILIRLVADNPGSWAFHCHISWHSEAGLAMQLLTRTDELARAKIPQANIDLCTKEGIEKGTGPDDDDYRDLAK